MTHSGYPTSSHVSQTEAKMFFFLFYSCCFIAGLERDVFSLFAMLVLPQTEIAALLFLFRSSVGRHSFLETLVNSSGGFATAADAVTYN